MKVSELIKLLKKSGCRLIRHGKSHDIWFSPITMAEFTVPRHKSKELANSTANSIIRQAGIKIRRP